MHFRSANGTPAALTTSTASLISDKLPIPVDIIIGRPFEATYSIRGRSTSSNEAIL